MSLSNDASFLDIQSRLNEIVTLVDDENLPLDEALKLYEEAVNLGLQASSLIEENMQSQDNESNEETQD